MTDNPLDNTMKNIHTFAHMADVLIAYHDKMRDHFSGDFVETLVRDLQTQMLENYANEWIDGSRSRSAL